MSNNFQLQFVWNITDMSRWSWGVCVCVCKRMALSETWALLKWYTPQHLLLLRLLLLQLLQQNLARCVSDGLLFFQQEIVKRPRKKTPAVEWSSALLVSDVMPGGRQVFFAFEVSYFLEVHILQITHNYMFCIDLSSSWNLKSTKTNRFHGKIFSYKSQIP